MEQINLARVADQVSYGALLKEVTLTAKDIAKEELALIRAEMKEIGPRAARHSFALVAFAAIAALGTLPLIAFLVMGLGEILDGRYALSSLLVALTCFTIGAPLAYRAYRRLKKVDLSFPKSRHGLEQSVEAVSKTAQAIQKATEGEEHASRIRH